MEIKNKWSFPKFVIGNLHLLNKQAAEVPDNNTRGRRNIKAFTLIELLVVVLIIGILSAIALPQYQTAVDKAHYSTMMAAVRALKNEQELYYLANGTYTNNIADLAGILPGQCNSDASDCGTFFMFLSASGNYATGRLLPDKVGIRNAFVIWIDKYGGQIECYAYKADGARGRKLCASMGGNKTTEDDGGCGGACTVYTLR